MSEKCEKFLHAYCKFTAFGFLYGFFSNQLTMYAMISCSLQKLCYVKIKTDRQTDCSHSKILSTGDYFSNVIMNGPYSVQL